MEPQNSKKARRRDLLLLVILLTAGISAMLFQLYNKEKGTYVIVHNGDEVLASFPLDSDTDYWIETSYGKNHLLIHDGTAQISEADCSNQVCVQQGTVSQVGEQIVCLPHRIVVEISKTRP